MAPDPKKTKRTSKGLREPVKMHMRGKVSRGILENLAPEVDLKKLNRRRYSRSALADLALSSDAKPNHRSIDNIVRDTVINEARERGYLDGEKTKHVSVRATPALIEAAMRGVGVNTVSELVTVALAMMAHRDPTAAALKETRGSLGKDHDLEY